MKKTDEEQREFDLAAAEALEGLRQPAPLIASVSSITKPMSKRSGGYRRDSGAAIAEANAKAERREEWLQRLADDERRIHARYVVGLRAGHRYLKLFTPLDLAALALAFDDSEDALPSSNVWNMRLRRAEEKVRRLHAYVRAQQKGELSEAEAIFCEEVERSLNRGQSRRDKARERKRKQRNRGVAPK